MVQGEPDGDRLGRLLSSHPVAADRYWSTGGTALAVGVVGGSLVAFLIAVPDMVGAKLLGYALISTLVGLPVAVVQLRRGLGHGRGEIFEIYENGFARRTATDWRGWDWQDIAAVRTDPDAAEAPAVTPIDRLFRILGWHFGCTVRLIDGSRVRIDGYAADGPTIGRVLLAHCPAAHSAKNMGIRVVLAVSPLAVLAFGVPMVLLYRHLDATSSDGIGSTMMVVAILVMTVCIVGLVMSLVVFVMTLVAVVLQGRD